jgi:hypothetical protein
MTTPDPTEMEEKLEDLQEGIDAARRQAQDHGTLPDDEERPTFADPDGDGRIKDDDEHPGEAFAT